jgi:hypothetical protein
MKRLAICLPLLLCACSSEWMVINGDHNQGAIEMGYRPRLFLPTPSTDVAIALAGEKCKGWGYEGARPFSAPIKHQHWSDGKDNDDEADDMVIQQYECVPPQNQPPINGLR